MDTCLAVGASDPASLDWHIFTWGLVGGAVAAGAAAARFAWTGTERAGGRGEMALPAAAQWKPSDSWASNLSAREPTSKRIDHLVSAVLFLRPPRASTHREVPDQHVQVTRPALD